MVNFDVSELQRTHNALTHPDTLKWKPILGASNSPQALANLQINSPTLRMRNLRSSTSDIASSVNVIEPTAVGTQEITAVTQKLLALEKDNNATLRKQLQEKLKEIADLEK